jgi:hypoxanthine-guanine phosphoribosyltransferase
MQSIHSDHRGTYVVTYDVASRLQSFRAKGFTVPLQNDLLFERFHMSLFQKIQRSLPGFIIDTIEMSELRRKIWEQVESRVTDLSQQVVLSTCLEITDSNPKSEGLLLNINRLFNAEGVMIGYGPRPRFDSLSKQLDELTHRIGHRSVILIEDGAFTGGTLKFVIHELESRGIKVTAIIVGFCCNGSRSAIQEVFSGEIVMVHPVKDLIDWIPDHDLIPFSPNCGRVIGEQTSEGFMPVQTKDGFSCAYPYILPFGKIEEWASLPTEGARDLSRLCLDTSIEIFSHVGPEIAIGELLGKNPRVSLPLAINTQGYLPALDMCIVAFLEQIMERIR